MNRTVLLRVATVAIVVVVAVLLLLRIVSRTRSLVATVQVNTDFLSEPETTVPGRQDLVFDPRIGHRLPRRAAWDVPGGVRRTNDHGLVRAEDLGARIPGPRVLWLADDLLAGMPNADTAAALVERRLRSNGDWPNATVLDATTAGDGLWHLALRAQWLAPRYQPLILVACIHLDDDLTALADEALPDRDQLLAESGPAAGADAIRRMARASIERLVEVAPRHGGTLLIVLIPDRDLLAAPADAPAHRTVRELHDVLKELHVSHVDLVPAFDTADASALYLPDGRLAAEGHARIAGEVAARIRRILDAM